MFGAFTCQTFPLIVRTVVIVCRSGLGGNRLRQVRPRLQVTYRHLFAVDRKRLSGGNNEVFRRTVAQFSREARLPDT